MKKTPKIPIFDASNALFWAGEEFAYKLAVFRNGRMHMCHLMWYKVVQNSDISQEHATHHEMCQYAFRR